MVYTMSGECYIGAVGAILCGLLGVITNGMTMLVILKQEKVRNNLISPLLFMMCFSNFVFSLICLPLRASQLFGYGSGDDSICQYFALLYFPNIFVSILTCALISLNRALALRNHAFAKRVFTWRKTIFYYNLMWQFAVGLMLLPLYKVWGKLGRLEESNQCTMIETETGNPQNGLFSITMAITIPIVASSIASIYLWMRSSTKNTLYACGDVSPELCEKFIKNEAQVTKTSMILVACFAILYLPNFLIAISVPVDKLLGLHMAGYIIAWCWVFINPVIYIFGNGCFKVAFKKTYGLSLSPSDAEYQSTGIVRNLSAKTLTLDRSAKLNWKKVAESAKKSSV